MSKYIKIAFLSLALIMVARFTSQAQTLIHYWSFNSDSGNHYTDTITPVHADYSDLDAAKTGVLFAEMPGTSAAYSTYQDYYATLPADSDNVNLQFGDSAGLAYRVRNPSDSMYLLFYIPTTHFKNINLAFLNECSSASHGQLQQVYSYSLDSGATWINSGGISLQSDSPKLYFKLVSITFTDTLANNNPRLVFRTAFLGNTTGTSGNNRFDNITVKGDTISATDTTTTGPSSVGQITSVAPVYTIYPDPAVNMLNVTTNITGAKSVAIYNEVGQRVYTGNKQGGEFTIDVTALSAGNYYINISGQGSGKVTTMKFVKK